ncbi:hypothetical protein [Algoriphagus boritolerans]|uniref:hypothetical protein n=1 Tax=Algoriphagus boritolerans TaxID=308111 RepID=UPI002FCE4208
MDQIAIEDHKIHIFLAMDSIDQESVGCFIVRIGLAIVSIRSSDELKLGGFGEIFFFRRR